MKQYVIPLIFGAASIACLFTAIGLYLGSFTPYYVSHLPVFPNPPISTSSVNTEKLLELINNYRKQKKLKPFIENKSLSYIAYLRAKDMFDNQEFTHQATRSGLTFSTMLSNTSFPYRRFYENLARRIDKTEEVVEAWKHSREHNDILTVKGDNDSGSYSMGGSFYGGQEVITVLIVGMK